MKEEKKSSISNKSEEQTASDNANDPENKENDTQFELPEFPKFEKIYENKDLNLFKEDILNYMQERDKTIFNLIKSFKEKMEKTENNYLELTRRISNNYSDILSSQADIKNRLDKLNSYESFSSKTNDQLISHEIRINNLRDDYNKSVQKYDKIYLDNLELPGYIGKYSKYKNCQVFFDDVIKELNRLNSYKEKNIIDLKAYKEKLESIIKTFNTLVDNNNKSQIKYINEMNEKNNRDCKSMVDSLGDRITEMRIENSRYAVELIGKSINLTQEWDKIQQIKEEIMKEFNDKIQDFRIVSNNTVNSFHDFKTEFTSIKRKFFELAEFIRDVRFRKNLGGDVKKKEIKNIVKKITGKKACDESIDKEKAKELLDYNFKTDKSEKNEKNDLRKSVSQEPGSKIKNYIKGVTNVEELKQDSKVHDLSGGKSTKKNQRTDIKKNVVNLNLKEEENVTRKKQKASTLLPNQIKFQKVKPLIKNKTIINSEESENSENNNSLNNLINVNNHNNNMNNVSIEGIGNSKNKNGNNLNSNNRYLYKDVPIETEDKIINELASELEQTNNKNTINDIKEKKEKSEKIQTLINKIEPMNINMNINKIENLNVNSNAHHHHSVKDMQAMHNEKKNNYNKNHNDTIIISVDKKMNNFDKKITNLEVYMKEKIIDLISQIENLRQLFLNTNKLPSFTANPLFSFPTSSLSSNNNNNINNNNNQQQSKGKEAHIVEIGAKILPPPTKVSKKYNSNSNNIITAKDKDKDKDKDKEKEKEMIKDINAILNINFNNKNDINLPKDISHRIKTGKNPTSIKTIINRTLGGNNNAAIFNNMANDFNSKFLKGVEKKTIIDGGALNKNIGENKAVNKYIDLNKITTNAATKTQNNFKNEVNLLAGDNSNLP